MKFNLEQDLGISKQAIRNAIDKFIEEVGLQDERMEQVMDALTLLNDRGGMYTANEAEFLVNWYFTAHDDCVVDNPEDFLSIEVHTANKKLKRLENALSIISAHKHN